jgi:hypothetical protein
MLILATPAAAVTLEAWSPVDLMKVLALAGLPTMLFFFGGPQREQTERTTARMIARVACVFTSAHSLMIDSVAGATIVTLALLISMQVAIMRYLEMRTAGE